MPLKNVWASRFIIAGIAQGALATVLTLYFVLSQVITSAVPFSKVIAGGSAGTWFMVGYATYLIVGVIGIALTALFYHYIEATLGKVYKGIANYFAWIHLIFANVGVLGATWLLIIGGYLAGAALQPVSSGGLGYSTGQVHVNIFMSLPFGGYPVWISGFIILLSIGVLLGGLGFVITWLRKE